MIRLSLVVCIHPSKYSSVALLESVAFKMLCWWRFNSSESSALSETLHQSLLFSIILPLHSAPNMILFATMASQLFLHFLALLLFPWFSPRNAIHCPQQSPRVIRHRPTIRCERPCPSSAASSTHSPALPLHPNRMRMNMDVNYSSKLAAQSVIRQIIFFFTITYQHSLCLSDAHATTENVTMPVSCGVVVSREQQLFIP